jgi:iron complex outermembrane receptor protein
MKKVTQTLLLLAIAPFALLSQIDSTKQLKEVVISGVRAQNNDPVSQSNVKKESIQKNYAGQDFSSLIISKAPSLTFYSDGGNNNGYMYLRMRGIDQTRINFTFNGISLAEPEDAGIYTSNYTDFMNNVNSIQIQRGVGVTPNGIGNLVGSVNFEGPNLGDSAYNDIQTGYGSFNSSRLSVGFNTGITKSKFAAYARYSNTYSDGYRYNSGTNANTFFTSIGYYGKKDIFKLTAFSGKSKNQMAYLATSIEDIKVNPRTNYLSPDERDDFNQQFVQFQHTRKTGQNSLLTSSLYYIGLQGQYGVFFNPSMYNFSLFSDMYGAMTTWALLKNKFSLRIGANGYSYYRNHSMAIYPALSQNIYSNRGNKSEFSAFTKVSYNIRKLTAFADLQFRTVNFSYRPSSEYNFSIAPITWTFFNPKAGLTYKFNEKYSSFFSVGQMHKEPTRNDMFAGFDDMDTSNVSIIGNLTKIKPEQVTDYELGFRRICPKLSISANAFFMQFKNEIAAIGQLSYIGLPLRKNVASSRRYGVEIEYTYKPLKYLTLFGSGTYMKANIDSYTSDFDSTTYKNIMPLLTPQWILNQSISYSLLNDKIDFTASTRYISNQFLGNDNNENFMVPEVFIFNGAISIRPTKRISISLVCNNITNKRIFNGGYAMLGTSYYYIGAPRNYYLTLNYKF